MAQNNPGQQLFDLLVTRGFDPEMLDSTGKAATSAEDAEIYSFEFFSSGGTNYGTVVIMLGDDKQLELFSGDNVGRGMDSKDKTEWYEFQHQLKNFATKNFMTFGSQNINRLKYSMQGQAALKEGLCESWNGTKNISWNGGPDSVRLMIRHKRPMGVNEARFRQVESLFLETAEGERYKLPFRNLAGGRAMVEHVRQGGRPYDMRGQHIANMVEELNVLSRFRRASLGRVFEGNTADLVNQTKEYQATMSRALKGLASSRGYNTYFESWNPADITEQDVIIEDIKTLFVEQTIDSRIEAALPILARLQQQGTAMKEANIFEAWANRLVEGTWATPDTPEEQQQLVALLSQEFPVGADATNATEQLYSLVGDDILFDQLHDLADQDAAADCRSVVLARIKELSDNGIEGFDTVLAALKAGQIAATAPVAPPAPPVAESDGSCNYTAEGEHCLEHGLMECGSGMYEGEEDTISRLRELSGMGEGEDDGRDKFYYQRNDIWRVMDGDELVHEYKPERYEVVGAKKLLARFDDEGYDVTHVISPMGVATYLYGKPEDDMAEGYYDLNDEGMQPIDLSSNPSFKDIVNRYTQLFYQGHEGSYDEEESAESDAIEQYVAQRFGQKGSDHLLKAAQASYGGRDDGRGMGGSRSSNLGQPSMPGGDFRTTKAGKMHKQDAGSKKHIIGNRLGRHPAPTLPESVEDSPVAGAITRRILLQRSDLLSKYGPVKVMAAIDDVADFVGDVEEIGSSDVSGWIKQVEQSLAGMSESLKEELQADDGEYYESADDFFGQFEAESFDNEETSPDGMEVRGYIDGVNVMVWRYDDESMTSGYGYYDDSAMAEEVAVTTGNPPLEEAVSLQGQYGHSGKLQKFDEVEQDIVARLRELSGMIRSA